MPFLSINKPAGWTSHDIVAKIRSITKEKTVGHAGTLDPFATGLLIIGIGRDATRQLDRFKGLEKEYETTMHFGATSDTQDVDGRISAHSYERPVTREALAAACAAFTGQLLQIPPMYSAKKVGGKKLYELARAGKTIERQPAAVHVFSIDILSCTTWHATLRIVCSPGTYIRTLVEDIGERLGCGAFAETLTRTRIGPYTIAQAHILSAVTSENWQQLTFT